MPDRAENNVLGTTWNDICVFREHTRVNVPFRTFTLQLLSNGKDLGELAK